MRGVCGLDRAVVMRRVVAALAAAAVALSLAACNTVKGAGRDLQEAGEAGERALDGD